MNNLKMKFRNNSSHNSIKKKNLCFLRVQVLAFKTIPANGPRGCVVRWVQRLVKVTLGFCRKLLFSGYTPCHQEVFP